MNRKKIGQLILPQLIWVSGNIAILVMDFLFRVIKVLIMNGYIASLRYQEMPSIAYWGLVAALFLYFVLRLMKICKRIRTKRAIISYILLNLILGFIFFVVIGLTYSWDIMGDDAI